MTAVAGHVTAGRAAPALPPADARGPAWPPRLAEGVELLGAYKDSGYAQPPSLVRRADGQVIQMSPLLYRVACRIDGSRGPDAIAALATRPAVPLSSLGGYSARRLPIGCALFSGRGQRTAPLRRGAGGPQAPRRRSSCPAQGLMVTGVIAAKNRLVWLGVLA